MKEDVLDTLFNEHYQSLLWYGISLSGSKETAEDLIQTAFYRLLLAFDTLTNDNYKAWLMSVMKHYYIDTYRRKNKEKQLIQHHSFPINNEQTPLSDLLMDENKHHLLQSIQQLKPVYQHVLILYYFAELSLASISDVLELNYGQTKMILSRGRQLLKKEMSHHDR